MSGAEQDVEVVDRSRDVVKLCWQVFEQASVLFGQQKPEQPVLQAIWRCASPAALAAVPGAISEIQLADGAGPRFRHVELFCRPRTAGCLVRRPWS